MNVTRLVRPVGSGVELSGRLRAMGVNAPVFADELPANAGAPPDAGRPGPRFIGPRAEPPPPPLPLPPASSRADAGPSPAHPVGLTCANGDAPADEPADGQRPLAMAAEAAACLSTLPAREDRSHEPPYSEKADWEQSSARAAVHRLPRASGPAALLAAASASCSCLHDGFETIQKDSKKVMEMD